MKTKIISVLLMLMVSLNVNAGRYIDAEELHTVYVNDWQKYQQFVRVVWNYSRRTHTTDWRHIKEFLLYGDFKIVRPVNRPEIAEVLGQVTRAVLAAGFDSPPGSEPDYIWGEVELPGIGNIGVTGLDEWYLFLDGNVPGLEQSVYLPPPKPGDSTVIVGK
jgi:hypothetical protein